MDEKEARLVIEETKNKYHKETILLNPQYNSPISGCDLSKFGGSPMIAEMDAWPCCDICRTPLNFVLQLFKKDFPEFYYPENKDLFQIFRCPNGDCSFMEDNYEISDKKMFIFYSNSKSEFQKEIDPPDLPEDGDFEPPIPDCLLNPIKVEDYPVGEYLEYEDPVFRSLHEDEEKDFIQWMIKGNKKHLLEKYHAKTKNPQIKNISTAQESHIKALEKNSIGNKILDDFINEISPVVGSKLGGYPSYLQGAPVVECKCGQKMEFLIQISGEEPGSDGGNWSPHGLTIGDLGNIYWFLCPACKTLKSIWDCG